MVDVRPLSGTVDRELQGGTGPRSRDSGIECDLRVPEQPNLRIGLPFNVCSLPFRGSRAGPSKRHQAARRYLV